MEQMELSEKMKKKLNEGRQFRKSLNPELRTASDGEDGEMIVEGHATTFNQPYDLYSYRDNWDGYDVIVKEQIDANAFNECDMSDVIMQYDHEGRVLARTRNNTLEVSTDETGLYIKADLSKSELGAGLYKDIKNGIIDRMSFAFTVDGDSMTKETDETNKTITMLRTITKIGKLYDVSAVSIPANDGTDISARSYSDGVIEQLKAERLEELNRERQKKALRLKLRLMEEKER